MQDHTRLVIPQDDPLLRDAIISEGGLPTGPLTEVIAISEPEIKVKRRKPVIPLDELKEVIEKPKTDDEWQKLAKSLKGTIEDIASGDVKASAAQAAMLKHILERAYGRVSVQVNEKRPASGILVLPTLGDRSNMQTCPRCGLELTPTDDEDLQSESGAADGLSG